MELFYLALAGFLAGAVNALAGGGPILTLGAMSAVGFDPRIASLTSTLSLSPGQIVAGWYCRASVWRFARTRIRMLTYLSVGLAGGAAGAAFLIATEPANFRAAVPWLVLFATVVYALSGKSAQSGKTGHRLPHRAFWAIFLVLSVYGGYFGGGNSFLVLALLAVSGLSGADGAAAKNTLIAAINFGAVIVIAFSGLVDWWHVGALAIGGLAGSTAGVKLLFRIDPRFIRPLVIAFGLGLTVWFFVV